MRGRTLVAVLLFVVGTPVARAANQPWAREALKARAALHRSVNAGYLSAAEAQRYRGILSHGRVVHGRVPPLRARLLEAVLAEVARPKSPTAPRALELYTTLQENADYLDRHRVPRSTIDLTGRDGVVYRFFARAGLAFHPLATAGRLNSLLAAGDDEGAQPLAGAIAERAVPRPHGSVVWEYRFRFARERAPWTSGMAQAVMAQALARAGDVGLARRAYQAIPGSLERELPAGPWIRLYSGSNLVVLNAQLQSAISIGDYAEIAQDPGAAALANRLLEAAKAMLPRFDTGHWSRYSLGAPSNLHYQDVVISLLKKLDKRTGDPSWSDAAARFALYETQPPVMTAPSVTRVVYPRPADGVRDKLVVGFWLSKPSKVAIVVDGKALDGRSWLGGRHMFRLPASNLSLGTHALRLVASSIDGNPGEADLGSFEVERDTIAPELAAEKAGGRVYWHAKDGESACCRIRLQLSRGSEHRLIALARPRGRAAMPPGYWLVTAVARDAAGNRSEKSLGLVIGHAR